MEFFNSIFSILTVLFMFAIVVALAYITTRYIGMTSVKRFKNSNMKIIEVMSLGYQKYLYIVKVADKHLILSVTKDDLRLLDTVDGENVVVNDDENLLGKDFKSIFESMTKKQKK